MGPAVGEPDGDQRPRARHRREAAVRFDDLVPSTERVRRFCRGRSVDRLWGGTGVRNRRIFNKCASSSGDKVGHRGETGREKVPGTPLRPPGALSELLAPFPTSTESPFCWLFVARFGEQPVDSSTFSVMT